VQNILSVKEKEAISFLTVYYISPGKQRYFTNIAHTTGRNTLSIKRKHVFIQLELLVFTVLFSAQSEL
jgi:hypothetical protein